MPNVGGPRPSKRRLLGSVVHSIMMYAAPVWESALKVSRTRQILDSAQCKVALRVTRAYRAVFEDAACVIAGIPPIALLAEERARVKKIAAANRKHAGRNRVRLLHDWQKK